MSQHARNAAGHPAAPAAELINGVVVLGRRTVLKDVSCGVADGEVVALLGANGSGKSTLIRAMIGLVPLAGGEARLFGTPLDVFHDWHRVGYVPQRTTAAAGVPATVREVVESGRLSRRRNRPFLSRTDRAFVDAALATVGLLDRARESVSRLSGGQQQRVLIARALTGEPDLLILDEPMAGVDITNQEIFAQALDNLRGRGTAILLVLHELGQLERLIGRAVVLRNGRLVHDGPAPAPVGYHALPGHDHVHPHAPVEKGAGATETWPKAPITTSHNDA